MVNIDYKQAIQFYDNSKHVMVSAIRDTSCSRGWLRLTVQVIFGIIIVTSFILIVFMAISSSYKNQLRLRQRCHVMGCRVICNDAPFFGEFEDEILYAVADTDSSCGRIILTLNRPMFFNSSLPGHWLSGIRVNVSELEIVGGNLEYILPCTFMSQFGDNLRVLVLVQITMQIITPGTFLGLSNLQELHVKESKLLNVSQNALQAVDNTLCILKIKADNDWDPVNITGSSNFEQLRVVDFSLNDFHNILGRNSFSELKLCKVLYLNWCKITAIGAGAFDFLKSIKIIHLNNNYLTSLPPDMFTKIIPLETRITLQENLWHCSCSNHNLRILSKLGLIIVDPICHSPISSRGLTFSEFEYYCADDPVADFINDDLYMFSGLASTINQNCGVNSSTGNFPIVHSPIPEDKCMPNVINRSKFEKKIGVFSNDNDWLKPAYSLETTGFSMVSFMFNDPFDYGLVWYKSSCPNEIYCINHLPRVLRVFNEDLNIQYTFCRIPKSSIVREGSQCVAYDLANLRPNILFYKFILLLFAVAILCLLFGALCVYALIHRNPILLKGNKRVVFVKHKTVDALILPPKIPLRCNLPDDSNRPTENNRDVFVIPGNRRNTLPESLMRTYSIRTTESNEPSYISALQPTDDQLAEWRIQRSLEVKYTYDSIDSNLSVHSQKLSTDSMPYYSIDSSEKIYDTIIG